MIYKYKTEGRSLKYFRNYQSRRDLFKHFKDDNINLKEVSKIRSRSNKKWKLDVKIKRSNKCNTKCWKFFWFNRN